MHFADDVMAGLVFGCIVTIITNNSIKTTYEKISTEMKSSIIEVHTLGII